MKYKVIQIYEGDYGCEGLSEYGDVTVDVLLEDDNGKECWVCEKDADMFAKNIEEGDFVIFENGTLKRDTP